MIHDETTNNKLLVLFILEKFEVPISEEILLQICAIDNDWIPYIYCQQVIHDLIRSGFITRVQTQANTHLITLTNDGMTCLAHFYNDISYKLREDVTNFIKEQRITYRKQQEFVADYYRNVDGSFTVALKILEIAQPLLDIKFVVQNRAIATSIYNSWKNKAPDVYKSIYDILVEN